MKECSYIIAITLLLFSCNFSKREPSIKQKEFAQQLLQIPGILQTEWSTTTSLRVTVDLNMIGSHSKLKAQQLADEIAAIGHKDTGEEICVNIYYPNLNKLASSCVF